ncbi:MAG: hypothetical protein GY953_49510 [bacterium]|nr:hypothetical protein [bacterium]
MTRRTVKTAEVESTAPVAVPRKSRLSDMHAPTPTSPPRRLRLNPVDYFFYCHHRLMQRRGEPGYVTFMTLDLDGHIEPARLRTTLERGFIAHPTLNVTLP